MKVKFRNWFTLKYALVCFILLLMNFLRERVSLPPDQGNGAFDRVTLIISQNARAYFDALSSGNSVYAYSQTFLFLFLSVFLILRRKNFRT